MITVCHVLDTTAGWEQRVALAQLLERLPADRYRQVLAATSSRDAQTVVGAAARVYHVPPVALSFLRAGALNRFLARESVDLVHAWGPHAAEATASSSRPLVVELFDPQIALKEAKRLRTLSESTGVGIACAAEMVRRRLVEGGVQPATCTVIRPGVDFQRINNLRRQPLRESLGISREHRLIVVPPSAGRDNGAFEAYWTGALLNHLHYRIRDSAHASACKLREESPVFQATGGPPERRPGSAATEIRGAEHDDSCGWRVIIPGDTRESRRIARFAEALPAGNALLRSALPFEELLVHANVLLAAGHEDSPSTAIAWAMAAGVPVIAAATRAHAELIAHKVNGLLYKPSREGSDAPAIVRLLNDEVSQAKTKEVASGQAYEVFGLRRYVEQHARIYDNLAGGQPASSGIDDSARSISG